MATSKKNQKRRYTTKSKKGKKKKHYRPKPRRTSKSEDIPERSKLFWEYEDEKLMERAPSDTNRAEQTPVERVQLSNEVRYTLFKDNAIELFYYDGGLVGLVDLPPKAARKLYKKLRDVFEESSKPKRRPHSQKK